MDGIIQPIVFQEPELMIIDEIQKWHYTGELATSLVRIS